MRTNICFGLIHQRMKMVWRIKIMKSTNVTEAKLIAKTLVNINAQMKQQGYNRQNQQKVGVVSFYQSQCRTIRNEIRKENGGKLDFEAIHVEINTVIRYQGKEKTYHLNKFST